MVQGEGEEDRTTLETPLPPAMPKNPKSQSRKKGRRAPAKLL
jgi:hypothetical protein